MSKEEKILQRLEAFDDSNIDYEHPVWAIAMKEGFHDELQDFVASCMTSRESPEAS